MNCGLGTLSDLKVHLLNEGLRTPTTFDATIAAIGRGVAERMEDFCNRKFFRTVGDTYEFDAGRTFVVVPRFPLETISAVALRETLAGGYVDQGTPADLIVNLSEKAGLVDFGVALGGYGTRAKLTYTGGFFFETLEPTDMGYPTATPGGSHALPAALKLAWLLQCERLWAVRDNLGVNISGDKATTLATDTLAALELVPEVKATLGSFVRQTLT